MEIAWTDIVKIVAGVIAALGGGGAIVAWLSSWLGKVWANRLMIKETAKFREDLERLTKQLERKNYVSKVRFDAEFTMYQELIEKFMKMVDATLDCYPAAFVYVSANYKPTEDEKLEKNKEKLKIACKKHDVAYGIMLRSAAFISQEMYEKFEALRKLCLYHNRAFMDYYCLIDSQTMREGNPEDFKTFMKTPDEIRQKRDILLAHLREYLSNLDVVDEK